MNKDQVSCFGFRTQYGGGKSTGFALLYDSAEAMKKFEPHYRLVRYGQATKIEKASRQQRTYTRAIQRHKRVYCDIVESADNVQQASKGRTAARSPVVWPRRRARARTRRNRGGALVLLGGYGWCMWLYGFIAVALRACMNLARTRCQLGVSAGGVNSIVKSISSLHSCHAARAMISVRMVLNYTRRRRITVMEMRVAHGRDWAV